MNDCWYFAGYVSKQGYGYVYTSYRSELAHRVMYESVKGEIPDGFELDHLCMNKSCINPEHLEAVTHTVNTHRYHKSVKSDEVCRKGHKRTTDNTAYYTNSRGNLSRHCKTCNNINHRKRYIIRERRMG